MTKNYQKAKAAIDQIVKQWDRTTLSDLEKYCRESWIVYGMVHAFLYYLDFGEYNEIKEYIYQTYGFNVGGTSGDKLEGGVSE